MEFQVAPFDSEDQTVVRAYTPIRVLQQEDCSELGWQHWGTKSRQIHARQVEIEERGRELLVGVAAAWSLRGISESHRGHVERREW